MTLATGVVVRSNSGGDITLIANNGDAAGTDDLTTGNVSILTSGNITLNADPDGNKTGGGISLANGTQLAGTTSSGANNVTLQSAKDIRVTGIKAVNTISVTSTAGSIVDDEVESTILDAKNVTLVANGNIGGANAITVADLQSQSGSYLGAIDVNIQSPVAS